MWNYTVKLNLSSTVSFRRRSRLMIRIGVLRIGSIWQLPLRKLMKPSGRQSSWVIRKLIRRKWIILKESKNLILKHKVTCRKCFTNRKGKDRVYRRQMKRRISKWWSRYWRNRRSQAWIQWLIFPMIPRSMARTKWGLELDHPSHSNIEIGLQIFHF